MQSFWNERYAEEAYAYGKAPNEFFARQLGQAPAGARLLLPCEGEGRNAVFAARQGWQVTAFDYSSSGLDKCRRLAAEYGVTVDYTIADAADYAYGEDIYDAVALIFVHLPSPLRTYVHRQLVAALKPGGRLILEAFNPLQINNTSGGPRTPDLLYTPELLAADFDGLEVQLLETATTELAEGPYHIGRADVVRLLAQKPLR